MPLGGLDGIVFTGGIGAGSTEIRERICQRLTHFGLDMRNLKKSANKSPHLEGAKGTQVFVVRCDENAVIARHVSGLRSTLPNI